MERVGGEKQIKIRAGVFRPLAFFIQNENDCDESIFRTVDAGKGFLASTSFYSMYAMKRSC
jgi:hypothetical protein